jgi:hypothetical protein
MVSDSNLLKKASDAGAQLVEAERRAFLARAEYHTAIRRLHLGGASLREIAEVFSLSHQRVQQIVKSAGGSWWQVWRRRSVKPDALCTWCDRPPSEVSRLIAGPKVFICDSCTEAAESVIRGAASDRVDLRSAERGSRARCSFCRKRADDQRSLVIGPANVCSECLGICREILISHAR